MNEDRLVGMYWEVRSAVVAVVRPEPLRLVAIAEVALPLDLGWPDPQRSAGSLALRALTRTRKQLGLPRWFPISLAAESAAAVPVYAVLLARAELPVAWRPTPDGAAELWSTSDVRLDGALQALAGDRAVTLAAGAALAARPLAGAATDAPIDDDEPVGEGGGGRGWSVQRLDGGGTARLAIASRGDEGRTR
jgi:hypothetical protein